jgi:N-acetylglucosamine malate deacetylase 1
MQTRNVIVVSAHPDDMEIGMGGTVAKLAGTGHSIISVVMTDGRRAPDPTLIGQEKMVDARKAESEKAAAVLGIKETVFFGFESIIDEESRIEAVRELTALIDRMEPAEVFTLHPELDRHPSHREAGKITVEALRQSHSNEIAQLWAYEVWGLFAEWDRFEDITDLMETKLAAIAEHSSQLAAIPYDEGVAGLNRWRAAFADPHQSEAKAKYAEVFLSLQ